MYRHRRTGVFALFALALGGFPGAPAAVGAQEREVVFHQVSVSSRDATLRLEFRDGAEVVIALSGDELRLNDRPLGTFPRGGAFEGSWRAVLAEAIALDNGAISRLLAEWRAPAEASGEIAAAAAQLEREFGSLFAAPAPAGAPSRSALEGLLRQGRLLGLASALEGIDSDRLRIEIGETVTIGEDEVVEGTLLVVDGSVQVEGRIRGDLIVVGGTATFGDGARVDGDFRSADTRTQGNLRAVRGELRDLAAAAVPNEGELRDQIRREIEASLRPAAQNARSSSRSRSPGLVRNVASGVGGLFQTLLTFGLLLGTGLALLYFFPRNVDVVARTARHATGRSAVVGLASFVLGIPVWVLGALILVVSIVGIPIALLWIPAFPLLMGLAMVAGYLAVAQNLGRWASFRGVGALDSVDASRPAMRLGIGLMVLLGGFAAGHVLQIFGGIFTPFRILVNVIAGILGFLAVAIGLGAVILSRAGKDPAFAGPAWEIDPDEGEDDPWAPDPMEPVPGGVS